MFEKLMTIESSFLRLLLISMLVMGIHAMVILVKKVTSFFLAGSSRKIHPKVRSLISLGRSIIIFILYFTAAGFVFKELGISLKAYFASASVIGLAVGFGSQGVIQDVVMGLTLIFSDLLDVGDMVEISSQTGIVKSINMRFVVLVNALGAAVYIPNRTIGNVINYPKGYIRCLVDVSLTSVEQNNILIEETVNSQIDGFLAQFPGIHIAGPEIEKKFQAGSMKEVLRIKFRIWPGRGGPIETTFKQSLLHSIKLVEPGYTDWMVSVNYEIAS